MRDNVDLDAIRNRLPPARKLLVIIIALSLLVSVGAIAFSDGEDVSGTIPLQAPNGPAVTLETPSNDITQLELTDAFTGDTAVDVTHEDGNATFFSQGPSQVQVSTSNLTGNETIVTNVSAPNPLTIDPADKDELVVGGALDYVAFSSGQASVNSDESVFKYRTSDSNATVTLDTNISSTTVAAVDASGTLIDSADTSSQGRVTFDLTQQSSTTQLYLETQPQSLELRNESNPDQLLDNVTGNVTVRFYEDGEATVIERTTSDGNVSLTGLPDGPLSIEVEAAGYVRRQAIIQSTLNQQVVYLLPENVTTSTVRFRVDDRTGTFSEDTSQIFVQKPIQRNNQTSYETVAASDFGPNGFTTELENGQRYRIKLQNDQGDTRILEPYSATVDETVTLDVSSIEYQLETQENIDWDFSVNENGENTPSTVRFSYSDPTNSTNDLGVKVYERGNESNILLQDNFRGPYGNFSVSQQVPAGQNATEWAVEWDATRNGNTITAQRFDGEMGILNVNMPTWFKSALSVMILLVVGGAGSQVNAPTVGIGVVFIASILWYIGFLPTAVTGGVLALALAIPALYLVSGNGGRV